MHGSGLYHFIGVRRRETQINGGKDGKGSQSSLLHVFHFTTFSFPCLLDLLPRFVPEPKDRSTSLLLIQVGRGCGSRVVTLPDVLKLQLGHVQQQSHSVNTSLFSLFLELAGTSLGPSTTHSSRQTHRPETLHITLP